MKGHKRSCMTTEDDHYPCTCDFRKPQIVIFNAELYRHKTTGAIKVVDLDNDAVWYTGRGIGNWCVSQYKSCDLSLGFRKMTKVKNFCGYSK